jgi:CRP-like cAMP-binding protein
METGIELATLRDCRFTADLPRPAQQLLLRVGRMRHAAAGERLLSEGAETSELGIVRHGRAGLRLAIPGRGVTTLMTVEPGDVYGWSAVVPPYRSTSTVRAIVGLEALAFPAAELRAQLAQDPEAAAAIYAAVLRVVARRLTATRLQLVDLFAHQPTEAA